MDDINLPIIKGSIGKSPVLSMDQYVELVRFNLEIAFDRESYWAWKMAMAVNAPFKLTDTSLETKKKILR